MKALELGEHGVRERVDAGLCTGKRGGCEFRDCVCRCCCTLSVVAHKSDEKYNEESGKMDIHEDALRLEVFEVLVRVDVQILGEIAGESVGALILVLLCVRGRAGRAGRAGRSCFRVELVHLDFKVVHNRRKTLGT